jgi:exocyst complex component 2
MISSKNFDPKAYLNIIQTNLSYQDLTRGIQHLRQTLDSRSEAIRILVEDDLDRFVAVKSSTDGKPSDENSTRISSIHSSCVC